LKRRVEIIGRIFQLKRAGRGKNPVRLTHRCLRAAQLSRFAAKRALRALEKAGVISVEHRRGRAPLVTHLWFPATV
jgi:hypothetical protein